MGEAFASKLAVAQAVELEASESQAVQQHLADIQGVLDGLGIDNVTVSVGALGVGGGARRQLSEAVLLSTASALDTTYCNDEAYLMMELEITAEDEETRNRVAALFDDYEGTFGNQLTQGSDALTRCATPVLSTSRVVTSLVSDFPVTAVLIAIGAALAVLGIVIVLLYCFLCGAWSNPKRKQAQGTQGSAAARASRVDRVRTLGDKRKSKARGETKVRLIDPLV